MTFIKTKLQKEENGGLGHKIYRPVHNGQAGVFRILPGLAGKQGKKQ